MTRFCAACARALSALAKPPAPARPIRPRDALLALVEAATGVEVRAILGRRRDRSIARARHVAIYLLRQELDLSYPELGRLFGRDHATAMASCQVVAGDEQLLRVVESVRALVARASEAA